MCRISSPELLLGDLSATLHGLGVGVVTIVENDGDVFAGEEEGDDHVRADVAQPACHDYFLRVRRQ